MGWNACAQEPELLGLMCKRYMCVTGHDGKTYTLALARPGLLSVFEQERDGDPNMGTIYTVVSGVKGSP